MALIAKAPRFVVAPVSRLQRAGSLKGPLQSALSFRVTGTPSDPTKRPQSVGNWGLFLEERRRVGQRRSAPFDHSRIAAAVQF
jgi:hypothetical protein